MIISRGVGAAGSLLGGLIGGSGARDANRTNLQIARENRQWQEYMSNTANQRAAADLEAAGLNRILAMGKPATTPSGNVATMQNEKAALALAANQASNIAANTALQIAQAKNLDARTDALGGAAAVGEKLGQLVDWITGKTGDTGVTWQEMLDRWAQDMWNPYPRSAQEPTTGKGVREQGISDAENKEIDKARLLDEIRGTKHYNDILGLVRDMDLPAGMSNDEMVQWALDNPDRVRAYAKRKMQ